MSTDKSNRGSQPLHISTPLIPSTPISESCGFKVYLKLENNQPAGSFKIRGIGNLVQKAVEGGCRRIVCSSGGNAGMAAAHAARECGVPATIIVPESTPQLVIDKLKKEKAEVEVHGSVWDIANTRALKIAEEPNVAYVPPFDHPDIWDGHATIIDEICSCLLDKPDLVITCVGGGGLLCGVVRGLKKVGWTDVPVLAMETYGANSFYQSVESGKLVTLSGITSVAKSLGALTVTSEALQSYYDHPIVPACVTDKEAVEACLRFSDDHRILVEPACGAALAGVYTNTIEKLQQAQKLGKVKSVVVIVCGGNGVNLEFLDKWKQQLDL